MEANETEYNLTGSLIFTHQDYNPVQNYSGSWMDRSFEGFIDKISNNEILENAIEGLETKISVVQAFFNLFFKTGLRNDIVISNLTAHDEYLEYEMYPLVNSLEYKQFVKDSYIVKFQLKLWIGKKGSKQFQIKRLVYGKYLQPKKNKGVFHLVVPSMELMDVMNPWESGIEDGDFILIKKIPKRRQELIRRAETWIKYLDYMIHQISQEQYCVKIQTFRNLNLSSGTVLIDVLVPFDYNKKFRKNSNVVIFPVESSDNENIWQVEKIELIYPLIRNLGNWVRISDTPRKFLLKNRMRGMRFQTIKIDLDVTFVERYQDNLTGLSNYLEMKLTNQFISNSVIQDLAVYKVQKAGIERLLRSEAENPYLGDFIFDYSKITPSYNYKDYKFGSDPLVPLNSEQTIALQKILANQNVTLIQGPPGTGKTTLIAELAHLATIVGKRVLIASQTNLAVDNAISRLEKVKEILPIRLGSTDNVTEDGMAFVEKNVVNTWFESVEKSLENKVNEERFVLKLNNQIEELNSNLPESRQLENEAKKQLKQLKEMASKLKQEIVKRNGQLDKLETEINVIKNEISKIDLTTMRDLVLSEISISDYKKTTDSVFKLIPWVFQLAKQLIADQSSFKAFRKAKSVVDELERLSDFEQNLSQEDYDKYKSLLEKRDEILELETDYEKLKEITSLTREIENKVKKPEWTSNLDNLNENLEIISNTARSQIFLNVMNLNKLLESLRPSHLHASTIRELSLHMQEAIMIKNHLEKILNLKKEETVTQLKEKKETLEINLIDTNKDREKSSQELKRVENNLRNNSEKIVELKTNIETQQKNIGDQKRRILNKIGASQEPIEDFDELVNLWITDNNHILSEDHEKWINLRNKWLKKIQKREAKDLNDLKDTYVQVANVVGATCYYSGRRDFYEKYGKFDYVVVDEVSKATPPELLLPILLGEKVVLVGDHRQLPPMYRDRVSYQDEENKAAIEISQKFKKLVTTSYFKEGWENSPETNRHRLLLQYRMHSQIMQNVNHFYRDKPLQMGYKNQDNERLHGFKIRNLLNEQNHIIWLDSTWKLNGKSKERNSAQQDEGDKSRYNDYEIEIILKLLNDIDKQNGTKERIRVGVITFYGTQVKKLRSEITPLMPKLTNLSIRFGTVDRFQGAERDVIIISLVGALPGKKITGFVKDFRRVNVALSRARKLLIIVGAKSDFELAVIDMSEVDNRRKVKIFSKIIDEIDNKRNALRQATTYLGGN